MDLNEGTPDRATRMVIGVLLMVVGGSGIMGAGAGVLAIVMGGGAFVSGLTGYCPLYRWMGWTTLRG